MKIDYNKFAGGVMVVMLVGLVLIIQNNILRERMAREITANQHIIIRNQEKILAAIDTLQRQTGGRRVR